MTKKTLFTLLAALTFVASFAQIKLTDRIPVDPDVTYGKLSNGLTYYIRKNTMPTKKVELRLAVNAGSVLENDKQQGLAHFMEHMGFNGSKHFPKNELVDFLQKSGVKFGADLNAYTGFDETVYILPVPVDNPVMLEKGLTVLEDWAFNNLFDKNEIEKERGVILEEYRLGKGADERMRKVYAPRLFNGSKYADRLPIGKEEILKNFKHQDLISFYKNWYRPNNMAVVVVGDIEPIEVKKMIEKHFGPYKNPAKATSRPAIIPIKERNAPEAMVLTDKEQTNTMLQIYNSVKPSPEIITWADYRKNTIEGLVSSLVNQRLNELIQSENPPFMFGLTGFGEFVRGYSSFNSLAVLGKGTLQDAINAIVIETNRAKQFGFLQSELDRIKASMLTSSEKAFKENDKSQSGQFAMQYVAHYLNGMPIPGVENRLNFMKTILPTITIKDVNDVAKGMPTGGNAFVLVLAPISMKDQLPTNEKVLEAIVAAGKIPVKPYEEKTIGKMLIDKEPTAGKVVVETKNQALGTVNFSLSNGTTVSIKPTKFKNDEIHMGTHGDMVEPVYILLKTKKMPLMRQEL
jgi:zinc protease